MSIYGVCSRVKENLSQGWANYKALNRKGKLRWWGNFLICNSIFIGFAVLIIWAQIYSIRWEFSSSFLASMFIHDSIARTGSALFLALGMGGIMVLGGFDLSAGRVLGLTACITASLLQKPLADFAPKMFPGLVAPNIFLVLLLAMVFGAVIGAFNGFFVSKFKLHPFIVTLGTQLMLYGTVLWYVHLGSNGGNPISGLTDEFKELVKGSVPICGIPIPYFVFYAIAAAAIIWFIWNKTTLGKNMYAVGANPEAANVSGVSVMKTTIMIFMIAGILYGVSGFIESARVGSNSTYTGVGKEVDAILACMIGGVSVAGGAGKIRGILIGVFIVEVIPMAYESLCLPWGMLAIYKGALFLAAAAINRKRCSTIAR